MPKNAHFALNVETRDLDFLDARNEKRKIVEIPRNRDVKTRRAATLRKQRLEQNQQNDQVQTFKPFKGTTSSILIFSR